MLSICTRPGHSTSAVRVTRHTNIIFIYAGHYLRELWWWNGDGEWRWGGDTGQLTYGGSGLTRHQAHDSKHMPAHSDTGLATHLHSSSPGPRQTTIMTLYSVKCHVDHPTAQQRSDENMSVVTWRLIRWRGAWGVGLEHSDTGRVIQPHRSSPGFPAKTFNFIKFKDACIACAMICRCRSILLTWHTRQSIWALIQMITVACCWKVSTNHISNIQYSGKHKNVMNVMWRSCESLGWTQCH